MKSMNYIFIYNFLFLFRFELKFKTMNKINGRQSILVGKSKPIVQKRRKMTPSQSNPQVKIAHVSPPTTTHKLIDDENLFVNQYIRDTISEWDVK